MIEHASVCTGVGMFELAALWNGWTNVFTAEIEAHAKKVLTKRFPGTNHYGDFTTDAFLKHAELRYRNQIGVLSAGLPCQPFSVAGKRMGQDDLRHLGPSFVELVGVIRPRWVLIENVAGFVSLAFDEFALALEEKGYTVGAAVLPACAVGAPHRRDRVWIIAHAVSQSARVKELCSSRWDGQADQQPKRTLVRSGDGPINSERCSTGNKHPAHAEKIGFGRTGDTWERRAGLEDGNIAHPITDTIGGRREIRLHGREETVHRQADEPTNSIAGFNGWFEPWAEVAARICGVDDRHAGGLDEPRYGSRSLADGTLGRYKTARLKAGGNALLPQIAYEIYKLIDHIESDKTKHGNGKR